MSNELTHWAMRPTNNGYFLGRITSDCANGTGPLQVKGAIQVSKVLVPGPNGQPAMMLDASGPCDAVTPLDAVWPREGTYTVPDKPPHTNYTEVYTRAEEHMVARRAESAGIALPRAGGPRS